MENNALAQQKHEQELAPVGQKELAVAFGGETESPAMELVLPVIKMSKEDFFQMPDETAPKELKGFIVFMHATRAYFSRPFGESDEQFPDCGSSDGRVPDFGVQMEQGPCATCPRAQWQERQLDGGATEMFQECKKSMVLLFLPDGKSLPHLMRVRSTSCGKKSSLAIFNTNCWEGAVKDGKWNGYALAKGKYQTVHVALTLNKTKIGNFQTSLLIVTKLDTLEPTDPRLVTLIGMYDAIQKDYKPKPEYEAPAEMPDTLPEDDNPPI